MLEVLDGDIDEATSGERGKRLEGRRGQQEQNVGVYFGVQRGAREMQDPPDASLSDTETGRIQRERKAARCGTVG